MRANKTNIPSQGSTWIHAAPTSGPSSGAISATFAISAVILIQTASSKDSWNCGVSHSANETEAYALQEAQQGELFNVLRQ